MKLQSEKLVESLRARTKSGIAAKIEEVLEKLGQRKAGVSEVETQTERKEEIDIDTQTENEGEEKVNKLK